MRSHPPEQTRGLILILSAFLIWGVTPIYFKSLQEVPPLEILAHRIWWSFLFLVAAVAAQKQFSPLKKIFRTPQKLWPLILSTLLVSTNWLIYIWAVINRHIMEGSLGYFILPIVSIFLGMLFLRERLNRYQQGALLLTLAGVGWQIILLGAFPWISLSLAVSFGLYGLIRKQVGIDSLLGLTIEITLLLLPALLYLAYLHHAHLLIFGSNLKVSMLLILSAFFTGVPLLLFVAGVRHLPLSTVGFYQYLSPTCQFLIALLVYHEPINALKLASYGIIWLAIGLYLIDTWRSSSHRKNKFPTI
jgi:chloramphenicol-sensitive protein RarD